MVIFTAFLQFDHHVVVFTVSYLKDAEAENYCSYLLLLEAVTKWAENKKDATFLKFSISPFQLQR